MSRAADALNTFQLRALCALRSERSVTRAAIRLNRSQSAISAVLRKLRELFGNELLVRSGQAMVATARGLQVLEAARTAPAENVVPLPFSSTHRGVIDRHLASLRLTRNARVMVPCPIDVPPRHCYQIRHPRNRHAARHRGLRALLKTVAESTIAPAASPARRPPPGSPCSTSTPTASISRTSNKARAPW